LTKWAFFAKVSLTTGLHNAGRRFHTAPLEDAMIRFFFMIVFAALVVACGNGSRPGDCRDNSNWDCEDSGETDPSGDFDPFDGPADEMRSVSFATSFLGTEEDCRVALTCGSRTITQNSSESFEVRVGSVCTATLGDSGRRDLHGRPLHLNTAGVPFTGKLAVEIGEEAVLVQLANWDRDELDPDRIFLKPETRQRLEAVTEVRYGMPVPFEGDWWLSGSGGEITCTAWSFPSGTQYGPRTAVVTMSKSNRYDIGDFTGDEYIVTGDLLETVGFLAERDSFVTEFELGANDLFVKGWSRLEYEIECSW
jgi:hypothetical protein